MPVREESCTSKRLTNGLAWQSTAIFMDRERKECPGILFTYVLPRAGLPSLTGACEEHGIGAAIGDFDSNILARTQRCQLLRPQARRGILHLHLAPPKI